MLANMKVIEAVKSAPRANRLLPNALAAYEHDELTMPKNDAFTTVPGLWSPSERCIARRDTNAWTAPDRAKPNANAQNVS
ncbi:hypothetical protein GCM10009858_45960 [Terrabacter carboxydivorans]|uniref:Uncharacterized protein n=1 Tax=Terrabacter carboxydivorans TaxID=619730 RepID=A0ABN3MIP3_9MICO